MGWYTDVYSFGIGPKISHLIARYAFTHVHLYWRLRVFSKCHIPPVRKVPPREHQSASRHPPRVPKVRGDQSRCFYSRNRRESHLLHVSWVEDDPCSVETAHTHKSTLAPILAVRGKYFDRVILGVFFVRKRSDIWTDFTREKSDTEFGRMLNQNMGVLPLVWQISFF